MTGPFFWRSGILLQLGGLMLWLLASSAGAATFRLGGDESLDCRMTISGQILPGDAEKFRAFLPKLIDYVGPLDAPVFEKQYTGGRAFHRLCLDSDGGSLSEAIKIADTLVYGYKLRETFDPDSENLEYFGAILPRRMGTAIPAGARCESACAVLFMAGGHFSQLATSDNGRDPDRVLHVDGKLGFHAPRIVVGEGSYSKSDIALAYSFAIESTKQLGQRLSRYWFPPSLLVRMLSTPPDEMYYVDTVEEAASWAIQIAGAPRIKDPSVGNLFRLCENMRALSETGTRLEDQYSKGMPPDIRADSMGFFFINMGFGHAKAYDWKSTVEYATTLKWSDGPPMTLDRQDLCKVSYDPASGETVFSELRNLDHGLLPEAGTGFAWALLPGYLTLADLKALAQSSPTAEIDGATLLPPVVDVIQGTCSAFSRQEQYLGTSPCTIRHESRQRADRRDHEARIVVNWPGDGGPMLATVSPDTVGQRFGDWMYLGRGIKSDTLDTALSEFASGWCFRNVNSGTARCISPSEVTESTGSVFRR